jgi:hypothetical protein
VKTKKKKEQEHIKSTHNKLNCSIPDEDITCLDTTTLKKIYSKVKPFFIMIIFDTFDELMLRHDVCSLSFLEIHTWLQTCRLPSAPILAW